MKYKVGQKVVMKEQSPRYVNNDMWKYADKTVTIAKIHNDGSFFISEDGWHWIWSISSINGKASKELEFIHTKGV